MNHPITRKEVGVALACYFRKENWKTIVYPDAFNQKMQHAWDIIS
jgi:hypothetical protein